MNCPVCGATIQEKLETMNTTVQTAYWNILSLAEK